MLVVITSCFVIGWDYRTSQKRVLQETERQQNTASARRSFLELAQPANPVSDACTQNMLWYKDVNSSNSSCPQGFAQQPTKVGWKVGFHQSAPSNHHVSSRRRLRFYKLARNVCKVATQGHRCTKVTGLLVLVSAILNKLPAKTMRLTKTSLQISWCPFS